MTQPNRYTSADWEDLWRRLALKAAILMSGLDVSRDCGVSALDLVAETLDAFWQSPNGLGWRENKGPLPVFLGTVLKNRFLNHLRRDKKILKTDGEVEEAIPQRTADPGPYEEMAGRELEARLIGLVKGRPDEEELTDFIVAGSMLKGAGKVNQQLAEIIGSTVGEVINRRKRLWRVAGVRALHEEYKNGRQTIEVNDKGHRAASRRPA